MSEHYLDRLDWAALSRIPSGISRTLPCRRSEAADTLVAAIRSAGLQLSASGPLRPGDGLIFAVNQRPVKGVRGHYRVTLRHGVSRLHSGKRHTLGIIFHDAT
jgi:hypothetical protein